MSPLAIRLRLRLTLLLTQPHPLLQQRRQRPKRRLFLNQNHNWSVGTRHRFMRTFLFACSHASMPAILKLDRQMMMERRGRPAKPAGSPFWIFPTQKTWFSQVRATVLFGFLFPRRRVSCHCRARCHLHGLQKARRSFTQYVMFSTKPPFSFSTTQGASSW